MAGFFRRVSETESDTSSSDEEVAPVVRTGAQPKGMASGFIGLSDSEEESKRVVRTAKDKRYEELQTIIKQVKNSKKINDVCKILTLFEDLNKLYDKARSVIVKEGVGIPRFYLQYLVELEDYVNELWEDKAGRKNLSKNNVKGLTTLRLKMRKYMKDFEDNMTKYRENPDDVGEDEEEVEEDDEKETPVKAETRRRSKTVSSSDDEPSDWEEMSSSTDSSSDDEIGSLDERNMEELRKYFLKKAPTERDEEKRRQKELERNERRDRAEKRRAEKLAREEDDEGGGWSRVVGGVRAERPKLFEKDADINHESVLKKLGEVLAVRGKKTTDRKEQIELLKDLYNITENAELGAPILIKVMFAVLSAWFDYNPKVSDCLSLSVWQSCLRCIREIMNMLDNNPELICSEHIRDEEENVSNPNDPYKVKASVLAMVERLDDEFTKILQHADCHSTDYVDKLKNEQDLCTMLDDICVHFDKRAAAVGDVPDDERCRAYMRVIDHLYYKFDHAIFEDTKQLVGAEAQATSAARIDHLARFIYSHDSTRRLRARALLCHVYHHALHDRYQEARDLLLMSQLQSVIDHSDIPTQILHNRTICQLGLCAFRAGYIKEAHTALGDILNPGKSRELLAQGLSMRRDQEKTVEQEKLEQQRQVPYHMHINLELLECVYLITAMLQEIPHLASRDHEVRRRMISRTFHYQLKQNERQCLSAPPENTREHVVAASRALLRGDYKKCRDYIINDKMSAKVWNLFHRSERVKSMVLKCIQEESLRTYLLAYCGLYDSVSLEVLSQMFEMEQANVHSVISKMIIQEELSASIDEPSQCVVLHRVEPSQLQTLALQLTEKLNQLSDNNEQILDPRAGQAYRQGGGGGNWFQQRQQHGGGGGHGQKGGRTGQHGQQKRWNK